MYTTFRTRLKSSKLGGDEKIGDSASRDLISLYRAIGIMTKHFLDIYCDLVIPGAKVTMISMTVFCTYTCMRSDGPLAAILGVLGLSIFVCLAVILGCCAQIYEDSVVILELMKSPNFTRTNPKISSNNNAPPIQNLTKHGGRGVQNEVELENMVIRKERTSHLELNRMEIRNELEVVIIESEPRGSEWENAIEKEVQSLHPIEIKMKGTYYIDKANTITVFRLILDETINFLIGNP